MADQLPTRARVVVIGAGVGGASVAYHLAEAGERDVLVLDRAEPTSGSTFHSAGLVGILRSDPTLTRMNRYSAELYARLEEGDHPPGWTPTGGLKLASSPERLEELRRQAGWARAFDLPLHEISVAEALELFPVMSTDGLTGAVALPLDGHVDPSQLCLSLLAGARAGGVRVQHHTRVLAIDTETDARGRARVRRVRTDRGDVECEVVVDCGGMFAAEIARMVGVRVPVVPMAHQYAVTEPLPDGVLPPGFSIPSVRDPDRLVYWRQEGPGFVMGGYERDPAPWSVSATALDAVPADFNGRLLAPDWDRFLPIAANAASRVPLMDSLGVRTLINGPEAFTPDNEFCLGETEVAGFFVAAGFNAHGIAGAGGVGRVMAAWVLDGDPGYDLWHMDIRRFGPAYASPALSLARTVENYATYYDIAYPARQRRSGRPLRTSPAYPWHAAHGAVFGEKSGWERVDWYAANEGAAPDAVRPDGWAGTAWSPAIAAEHRACRERAALFDESSFGKLLVTGPDAATALEALCDNRVARDVGAVTYTQLLNDRGGIECDLTVTRTGPDEFLLVTGTAFAGHDLSWVRRGLERLGADATARDVTGSLVVYGLWGPLAREILAPLTTADLSRPFMTSQTATLGTVPVRLTRVTFVGELGWEIYASTEYGAGLWSLLMDAGAPHGLLAAGYRAIDSLRLEKGYRVWAGDLTPETTPDEAGLSFCVKLAKPGGFTGRDALAADRETGLSRRLVTLRLAAPTAVAVGGEPVRTPEGTIVGRVTSAGQGFTPPASLALAYLPLPLTGPGTRVAVDLFGTWVDADVVPDATYDPTSARVRA
ncbi:FAD-dependent oxidoreductase [Spongisporangium articulatum]|uniref:FAD-dependent oxidoreductase n=1 Tax=Spongisporangium articulatum TaxID=3362603 RepID=A0ABW8AS99_9ACTN